MMLKARISSLWRLAACACLLLSAACAAAPTAAPTATPIPPTPIPPTATPQVIRPGAVAEIEAYLDELAQYKLFSGAVLIGHQGKVLFGKGYGEADQEQKIPNTLQTRFRIDYLTWDFTAVAILILQSQGKLDLQDPACKYVPDCPESWKDITVQHLLSHSSGIPGVEPRSIAPLPATPEQVIAGFMKMPLDFSPPGQRWQFSISGYFLLGYIIEKVSGLSYAEFLQRSIFTPLNLRNTGYVLNATRLAVGYSLGNFIVPQTDPSVEYASSGLYSSAEDLYLWDQAIRTDILFPQAYSDQFFANQFPDQSMAYCRGLTKLNGRSAEGAGSIVDGFTGDLTTFPDEQVTLIILSNQEGVDVFGQIDPTIINILFGNG
jgi:CubicO group peptidase (beta-lactamase class C family)